MRAVGNAGEREISTCFGLRASLKELDKYRHTDERLACLIFDIPANVESRLSFDE